MARDKIQMPSSTAGITRYFDEFTSKYTFKPGHVIVLAVIIMVLVIVMHRYGASLLGLR